MSVQKHLQRLAAVDCNSQGLCVLCRKMEAAAPAESGTVVVKDDKEAQQQQTRWNAWLEKGEHGGNTVSASMDGTARQSAVRRCFWKWLQLHPMPEMGVIRLVFSE